MSLETERLILDQWQGDDWEELRPIATDPEVMRYITGGIPWSDETIQSFVDRQMILFSQLGLCRWKLIEKASNAMIGFCGVGRWRDALDLEIGWWLARACWRRGLATEAARMALHDAFERAGLERVVSVARPANLASIRIMQKLGLEFDCEFENEGVRLVRYAINQERYRIDERRQQESKRGRSTA